MSPAWEWRAAAVQQQRVKELLEKYPPLADAHRDAFGHPPRRTWFFPPHDHVNGSLRASDLALRARLRRDRVAPAPRQDRARHVRESGPHDSPLSPRLFAIRHLRRRRPAEALRVHSRRLGAEQFLPGGRSIAASTTSSKSSTRPAATPTLPSLPAERAIRHRSTPSITPISTATCRNPTTAALPYVRAADLSRG